MATNYRLRNAGTTRDLFKITLEYVEQMVAPNGAG